MRKCLLNDCTDFKTIAPCCLDCDQRNQCPDRCLKSETTFCVGVIDDGEGISKKSNKDQKRD